MNRLKRKLYEIINPAEQGNKISKVFDVFIMTLITLNILALMLETEESLAAAYGHLFVGFELFSVIIFSIEYVLRIWTCNIDSQYNRRFGRIRYMFTPMALIDLLAVLPFYLPMLIKVDLRFVRALRLFRLFRLLKFGRYSKSVTLIGKVFRSKKEELVIVIFVVMIMLIFSASFMYYVESSAQPEAFSSIPQSIWWGVATLTTVGYGDVYPVTDLGRLFAALITILGIGIFALPTGILASAFIDEMTEHRAQKKAKEEVESRLCPHCGKDIYSHQPVIQMKQDDIDLDEETDERVKDTHNF